MSDNNTAPAKALKMEVDGYTYVVLTALFIAAVIDNPFVVATLLFIYYTSDIKIVINSNRAPVSKAPKVIIPGER